MQPSDAAYEPTLPHPPIPLDDGDAATERGIRDATSKVDAETTIDFVKDVRGDSAAQPSRADTIRDLRASGLTLREICERLGIAKSAVNRALYPRVLEYEKTYNRERYYTATCQRCGKPCTHNIHAPRARGLLCAACYQERPFQKVGRDSMTERVFAAASEVGRGASGETPPPPAQTANAATSDPCACKGWRGLWRVLLWGVPHVFCDGCNREVRDA